MSLEISPEIEARLLAKARELGLSVDALLQFLLGGTGACGIPVWDLGISDDLRRTGIYNDADCDRFRKE
jgi:hypothetical protein